MASSKPRIEDIKGRLKLGKSFLEKYASIVRGLQRSFLQDYSFEPGEGPDGEPSIIDPAIISDVPIGTSNRRVAAILTKYSIITYKHPDWHVEVREDTEPEIGELTGGAMSQEEAAAVWRDFMAREWQYKAWDTVFARILLDSLIGGLGVLAWGWNKNGIVLEHVPIGDLRIDPYIKDWNEPAWGGRVIRMSLREAAMRYKNGPFKKMIESGDEKDVPYTSKADRDTVKIEVYWDSEIEAHVYQDELLIPNEVADNKNPYENLYAIVPLLFLTGTLIPGYAFPISDAMLTFGTQEELSELVQAISAAAKKTVGITAYDPDILDPPAKAALENPSVGMNIPVRGLKQDDAPFYNLPPVPLPQALLEAKRNAELDLQALLGVSDMDMGILMTPKQTATALTMARQGGGAMRAHSVAKYETFMNRVADVCLLLVRSFMPVPFDPDTGLPLVDRQRLKIIQAAHSIRSVQVIEGSMAFREPAMTQQQAMQLFELGLRSLPMFVQYAPATGGKIPNIVMLFEDVLRTFGKMAPERYFVTLPQAQPQGGLGGNANGNQGQEQLGGGNNQGGGYPNTGGGLGTGGAFGG